MEGETNNEKNLTSLKRGRDLRSTASEREWQLQVAERFSREEELEVERALQLNS